MTERDQIIIEGLRIDSLIGVYAHERERPQPLVFDVALGVDLRAPGRSDQLADTLDYATIVAVLRDFVAERSDQLLERLAEDCCALLAARFRPRWIRLHVRKPEAARTKPVTGLCSWPCWS